MQVPYILCVDEDRAQEAKGEEVHVWKFQFRGWGDENLRLKVVRPEETERGWSGWGRCRLLSLREGLLPSVERSVAMRRGRGKC